MNNELGDAPLFYEGESADVIWHHGALQPAMGARHFQVVRANRSQKSNGLNGNTYNHAPMLAHCHNRFYLSFLSAPIHEHEAPTQTFFCTSQKGETWSEPRVLFPAYAAPNAIMHQRSGFYQAPNGVLLALGFYGISPQFDVLPFGINGIGRVARQIFEDNSLGAIHFVRFNPNSPFNEINVAFPLYSHSDDTNFREACASLLQDRLATASWWEENRSEDGFFSLNELGLSANGLQALSHYRLPDNRVLGVWKWGFVTLSDDDGQSWRGVLCADSLATNGAKIWGEKTSDGRYALVFNPTRDNSHRWPLAISTSDDGQLFKNLNLVNGEVNPRRYAGIYKDFGLQYVRGLEVGASPDGALWLAYSVNKEDIWVSRLPIPISNRVLDNENPFAQDAFRKSACASWNLRCGLWARAQIEDGALVMRDCDPADCAVAEYIFPAASDLQIDLKIDAQQTDATLQISFCNARGQCAFQISFDDNGVVVATSGKGIVEIARYETGQTMTISISVACASQQWRIDDKRFLFTNDVTELERIVLRTTQPFVQPTAQSSVNDFGDLPNTDAPTREAVFRLYSLTISKMQ